MPYGNWYIREIKPITGFVLNETVYDVNLSLIHIFEFVDEGRIKMRPAVELSYLNEDCQRDLVDEIDLNDCTPVSYTHLDVYKRQEL